MNPEKRTHVETGQAQEIVVPDAIVEPAPLTKPQKRERLREILPVDLQLEFALRRPGEDKWDFDGKLGTRKDSEINEDRQFMEAVRILRQDDLPSIEAVEQESRERKAEIGKDLHFRSTIFNMLERRLNSSDTFVIYTVFQAAQKLGADAIIEKSIDRLKGMVKNTAGGIRDTLATMELSDITAEIAQRNPTKAYELCEFLLDTDAGCQKVTGIAPRLQNTEYYWPIWVKGMEKRPDLFNYLAKEFTDPEQMNQAVDLLMRNNQYNVALKVAEKVGRSEEVIVQVREKLDTAQKDYEVTHFANILLEHSQATDEVGQKLLQFRQWREAANVAVALGNEDLAEQAYQGAKQARDNKSETYIYNLRNNVSIQEERPYGTYSTAQEEETRGKKTPEELTELKERFITSEPNEQVNILSREFRIFKGRGSVGEDDEETIAQFLHSLNETNPEVLQSLLSFRKERYYDHKVAVAVAVTLREYDYAVHLLNQTFADDDPSHAITGGIRQIRMSATCQNMLPESQRLVSAINQFEDPFYAERVAAGLLEEGRDLGSFQREYLPGYLGLKEQAKKVNDGLDATKQWEDPEEFFRTQQTTVGSLHVLNDRYANQLLRQLFSRGLSFTEANLQVYSQALEDKNTMALCQHYVKHAQNFTGYNMGELLEIASAYKGLEQIQLLYEGVKDATGDWQQDKQELNRRLLSVVATSLGIEVDVASQDLSNWQIKYLANLVTNEQMLKEKDRSEKDFYGHTLYQKMLKACFEGNFQRFISEPYQEDYMGREVAQHNQQVEASFRQADVDWEQWHGYDKQVNFEVSTVQKVDRSALFNQFEQRMTDWRDRVRAFNEPLSRSLDKDLAQLAQRKRTFDFSSVNLSDNEWVAKLFPTYTRGLQHLQSRNAELALPDEIGESFQHLTETIHQLQDQGMGDKTVKKALTVKLWDRDPRHDLFQGNATACCVAVGVKEQPQAGGLMTYHPETILQYLVDKGIQVVEVVDPETNEPVAQVWLFVNTESDGTTRLVADNIEVNNRYPAGNNVNRGMREAMFEFLADYSQACNVDEVVIADVKTNDVETQDLPKGQIDLRSGKLGGYMRSKPYYLEAIRSGHEGVRLIAKHENKAA